MSKEDATKAIRQTQREYKNETITQNRNILNGYITGAVSFSEFQLPSDDLLEQYIRDRSILKEEMAKILKEKDSKDRRDAENII